METTEPLFSASINGIIQKLQGENETLKEELSKKQEQINRTNAYWKGKYFKLEKRLRNSTPPLLQHTAIAI